VRTLRKEEFLPKLPPKTYNRKLSVIDKVYLSKKRSEEERLRVLRSRSVQVEPPSRTSFAMQFGDPRAQILRENRSTSVPDLIELNENMLNKAKVVPRSSLADALIIELEGTFEEKNEKKKLETSLESSWGISGWLGKYRA
jgi:hypothetical protein